MAEKSKSQPEQLALLGADGPKLSGRGHRAGDSSWGAWGFLSLLAESPVSESLLVLGTCRQLFRAPREGRTQRTVLDRYLDAAAPAFLAPGTSFVEDNFSTD